jgi:AAA domain
MPETRRRHSAALPPPSTGLDARSEASLERLTRALRSEETRLVLFGPPGCGKSSVLHALPQRLGHSFASVHIPNPWLGLEEIRAWIESFAGPLPADAGTSFEDLVWAHGRRGAGLVLMIDDANGMPIEIAGELDALVRRTDRALRIVLAGLDDERLAAVLAAFGAPFARVELEPAPEIEAPRETARPVPRVELAPLPRPPMPEQSEASAKPTGVADTRMRLPAPVEAATRPPAPSRAWRTRGLLASAGLVGALALGFAMGRWTAPATPQEPTAPAAAAAMPDVSAPPPAPVAAQPAPAPPVAAPAEPAPPVVAASPPPAEPVRIHINAKPWARVAVDGRDVGMTPLGNVALEPGMRRFRAELPDGRVIERDVDVGPDTRRVTFP